MSKEQETWLTPGKHYVKLHDNHVTDAAGKLLPVVIKEGDYTSNKIRKVK